MDHPEDLTPEELAALSDEMTDAAKLTREELRALLQRRLDRLRQERRKLSDKLQELDPSAEGYGALMNYLEKDSQKHREIEAQLAQLQKRQTGITSITIQNFKGISVPVTIPLRPITLLFGANSAGKSTILQAIHYVRELLDRNNANPDQTLLGGEAIEMGGFRNLVHKHDLEREIRIRLEITPTDDGVPTLEELLQITDQENGLEEHSAFNINAQVQTVALELAARWDFGREEGWFSECKYFVNGEEVVAIRKPKADSLPAIEEIQYFHPALLALDESLAELKKEFDQEMRRFRAQWLAKMVDFATALSPDARPEFEFDLVHSSTKATIIKRGELIDRDTIGRLLLNLPNIVCTANSEELFPVFRIFIEDAVKKFKEKEHELLNNCGFFPLIQLNGQISPSPSFLRPLPFAPSALGDEGQPHWATINQIVIGITALTRQHLDGFRYIGPIRAIPDRHHEAPQVEDPSRWANGLGAWDLLLRHYDRALGKGDAFVEEVSKWFEDKDRLGLGYGIGQYPKHFMPTRHYRECPQCRHVQIEMAREDFDAACPVYCQMLTARFAMRDLLKNALEVLRCKAECSHSCRTCLQGYENQIYWDKLNRKPVLVWLERVLNINQAENPFDRFNAAPLSVTNGSAIFQAELETANHLLVVAPRLFNLQKDAMNENHFGTPETVAFAKKLVSWMTAGNTLEIALPEPPLIHADFPNSIWVAERLKTCMEDGSLKLCRLPASFDPRQWPRAVVNPDKNGSRAFFSTSLFTDGFLDLPLPTPLWKGPSPDAAALQAMRLGWVSLDSKALRIPKDTTLLEYSAGQSRDYARDFSFCKGKNFALVRIEDPFILKTDWNYKQLKRFLEIVFPLMASCPAKIELRTRVSEEPDQKLMIQDFEKWLKGKGATFSFQLVPTYGFGKKDFHDRRLVFQPDPTITKKRTTILMTGGIDRYIDLKFECSIVIQT